MRWHTQGTELAFWPAVDMSSLFTATNDLAIDLGTVNTCIYSHASGTLLSEPSLVAFNTARSTVEAVGTEARDMLGRMPENVVAVRPMRDGAIADFEAVQHMLGHFIRKAHQRRGWRRRRFVIGVPCEITPVERRAVRDSALKTNAKEVHLVQEPVAAAIGAGMPVKEPYGNMVVDIGGGTTDIAVVSSGGIVYTNSVRVAGNAMDAAIIRHVRKRHQLVIGERTAEDVKIRIGSALPLDDPLTMEVKGRHLVESVPQTVIVNDDEIREALADTVKVIVSAVMDALAELPPELCGDIFDRGLVMTGGASLLRNLDSRLRLETRLPVQIAEEPLSAAVIGASRLLADAELLRGLAAD